ncbi:polysaccharide lyase family 8 super-sandwich domain-containing protein [Pseudomonas parafulva]|uniref:polysaccharide lyase family 8 super-sandwich domain-containing protein n=1 Tax=Pseudomonas parafulva TaxID=157782 RepID=UPI000540D0BF|nr:polysaccharide lyase family 8 super-sandwich domain-containing protein [Pseudomonas parafulva]AIZ35416.1 hypothetical protein NJ69_21650 [Pseudomonas parafulva]
MSDHNDWVQAGDASLSSAGHAKIGETLTAFLLDPNSGQMLARVPYKVPNENESYQHSWTHYFAEAINKANTPLRAGEKNASGGFDTPWSSYRNRLWKPRNSNGVAFSTHPGLSNWVDVGAVDTQLPVAPGLSVRVVVSSPKGPVHETIDLPLDNNSSDPAIWPAKLASLLDERGSLVRIGLGNATTQRIEPQPPGSLNRLWLPRGADLRVQLSVQVSSSWQQDAEQVYQRLCEVMRLQPDEAETAQWLAGLQNGRFADIRYPTSARQADVDPLYLHLERTRLLASCSDAACTKAAADALVFYASSNYQTTNWWHRQIGLARAASAGLVLLADGPQRSRLGGVVDYLQAAANTGLGYTGANQADFAYIQLHWAIAGWKIKQDDSYLSQVAEAVQTVSRLCLPVSLAGAEQGEGIRVDHSFSQHNPAPEGALYSQLYAATYGFVLLNTLFAFKVLLTGVFSLERESVRNIERFMVQGLGWFAQSGFYDFHVCGRAISRGMEGHRSWARWCDVLLADAPQHPELLRTMKARALGQPFDGSAFKGNRAYWTNDYMSHLAAGFALFAKLVSTRTVGTESGNGENLKGYYLGCGSYFAVASGEEYKNIQPLWDWQKLPGTTVEQVPNFAFPLIDWGYGAWGSHDATGVVSNGAAGVASMQLTRGNISDARKSVMAVGEQVYCLGNAGNLNRTRHPVCTTVNQSWLRAKVQVRLRDGRQQTLDQGRLSSEDIAEVIHDGFVYRFLHVTQRVTVDISARTGAWSDINRNGSAKRVRGTVFSLWVEHEKSGLGDYCYSISRSDQPAPPSGQCTLGNAAHVLTGHGLQGAMGTLFTDAEVLVQLEQVQLTLSGPLAFIAEHSDASTLRLTLADLTQKRQSIVVHLNWAGKHTTHTVDLPTDEAQRGKSLTLTLTASGLQSRT